jgi:hypothetical protein
LLLLLFPLDLLIEIETMFEKHNIKIKATLTNVEFLDISKINLILNIYNKKTSVS